MLYEDAKKIALQFNSNFNSCREYENAYHFFDKNETDSVGGNSEIVILKETGESISFTSFILDYKPKTNPKDIDFNLDNSNLGYVEPADYFPKEIRKKYKLGEYADNNEKDVE